MPDQLTKILAYNNQVRVYLIRGTETVTKAMTSHQMTPQATKLLGESLIAGQLLGASLLKNHSDHLTIRIQGNGPLAYLLISADAKGNVRGYVQNPQFNLAAEDLNSTTLFGDAIGEEGLMSVTKEMGLKTPFGGQVPLISDQLAENFTFYMASSEQIPSIIGLAVNFNADLKVEFSGGFMVQLLPHAAEETILALEAHVKKMTALADLLQDDLPEEELIQLICGTQDFKVVQQMDAQFYCPCSLEKFEEALISLGSQELENLIQEEGQIETVCYFCGETYKFSKDALEGLLLEAKY